MPTDEQRLVVALEAKVRDFERQMQRADKAAERSGRNIARAADRAGKDVSDGLGRGARDADRHLANLARSGPGHLTALGAAARTAAGDLSRLQGVLAGAFVVSGVDQMVRKVREASAAVAELKTAAAIAGVDTSTFQRLTYAGDKLKINADTIQETLKEFGLRIGEATATGTGAAADAYRTLGYTIEEVATKGADKVEFLYEVLNKIAVMEPNRGKFFLEELFGGEAGEKAARILEAGVGKFRDMAAEAERVGAVLDNDIIAKGVILDQRFAQVAATVETRLTTALINAGGATFKIVDALDAAIGKLQTLASEAGNADIWRRLNNWMDARGLANHDGLTYLNDAADDRRASAITKVQAEADRLTQELAEADKLAALPETTMGITGLRVAKEEAVRLRQELEEANRILGDLKASSGPLNLGTIYAAPAIGPAMPATMQNYSDSQRFLEGRIAHNGVNVSQINEVAAKAAAAVLANYPGAQLSSGYRSPETNRGAKHSQHLGGNAIDVVWPGATDAMWQDLTASMIQAGARGIGRYNNGSAHFDWRTGPRAAWGPNYSSSSLGQTEPWFQDIARNFVGGEPATANGAGAGRDAQAEAAKRQADAIASVTENLRFESAQLGQSALQQEINNQLRAAGVTADSAAGQEIANLVTQRHAHADALEAEKAATERKKEVDEEAARAQEQLRQQLAGALQGSVSGFLKDLMHGKSAAEALQSALMRLADQMIEIATQQLFANMFAPPKKSGGGFGGLGGFAGLFSLFGFADGGKVHRYATGGYVSGPGGPRSDSIPAALSNGEFVVNANATRKFGPLLAAINEGRFAGFAGGGGVGGGSTPMLAGSGGGGVTQNISITVESKATGDPAADAKAADLMAKAIEAKMRHVVVDEVMKQQRSGGILDRRR